MKLVGSKVLVTGADGFIGSHLAEALVQAGAHVRGLVYYNSFNSKGWLDTSPLAKDIELIAGDVRDGAQMQQLVQGMDIVFHLAALIAIPYSYRAAASYVQTNVEGTLNIVQAARDQGGVRVLHTSTSEVYGTARQVPIGEDHPLQPQSPYSASKIAADAMAMSFHLAHGLPLTIVRPFNTYGPRQSARAVIPTIITQILKGKRRIKLGSLSPTRDFNYVSDTCAGFLALAECDAAMGKTVNIGSDTEISIGDTARLIANTIGASIEIESDEQRLRPTSSEVERLHCDNSQIRALTGFKPQIGFEEGLARTVEWFRQPQNLARYDADVYNV
ncbi:MAG TPA: NAD-dependent 4,6-dehydratase LegB [Rhizomicrobium sp.]|nr:NAD-dependent 4,6-dehydratase LegB [Rhizomicrobium sp.]